MTNQRERLLKAAVLEASAAAIDPGRWKTCICAIQAVTGSNGAALFRPFAAPKGGTLASSGSMMEGAQPYFEHWIHHDPWNRALAGSGLYRSAGEVLVAEQIVPASEFQRTAYFNEHARNYDCGYKLFLKICDADDPTSEVTHLTVSRGFDQPQYDDADVALMRRLWQHLQAAVASHDLLRRTHLVRTHAAAGLELLPHPCFIVRPDRRIDFANAAGSKALSCAPWLRSGAGRLIAVGDLDDNVLTGLLRDAGMGMGARHLLRVATGDVSQPARAVLRSLPIRNAALPAAAWPHATAMLMLELTEDDDDRHWIARHVKPLYGLTKTEALVLKLLVAGREVPEIGAALHVSDVTIRTHLRALREKTGRRSQVALVRLGLGR